MAKCSLELWPVLVWWTIVITMIIPFTTLFWVIFLILLALTPLFEIVNTVRGKRTPISRWRWDAAIEAYEPDEPIATKATQHWSTVDVETPRGIQQWRIHYFRSNANARPASRDGNKLLLIHGVASGAAGWAPEIVEELAKEYDVFCMSLPGSGNPASPEVLRVSTQADAIDMLTNSITAFIKAEDLGQPVVVAHSLGGWLTLECTLRYPGTFSKMVLCDAPGFLPWMGRLGGCWAYYFNASPLQRMIFRRLGALGRWVFFALFDLLSFGKTVYYWIAIASSPTGNSDRLVSQTIDLNYATGYSSWNRITVPRILLNGLSTPTCLVWGEHDSICDSNHGSYVAGLLGLDHYFVPGAGHAVMADAAKFLEAVKKALASTKMLKPASDDKISKVNGILSDGVYSSSFAKDRTQQNTFALHERLKNWTAEA